MTVTALSITPRGSVLRLGDEMSSSVTYRANVPTKVSNYGGWVYSGTPARTGSCMGQPIPPAPSTNFPFIMNEFRYAAGRVTSAMGSFTFNEGTDYPYEQTNRYVYRVRIYNANTNQMLYCYQKVWQIQRGPILTINSIDAYPQSDVIHIGDTFGQTLTYTATVATRVRNIGGWVSTPISTGKCADVSLVMDPGQPFAYGDYPAGPVTFSWGPLVYSSTAPSQMNQYVLQTRIFNADETILLDCYQKVWTVDTPSTPTPTPLPVGQITVNQMDIFPQTGIIRAGDAFGHNVNYTANIPTTVDVYSGWVYSGVAASTGSCLDQIMPPAPGTDFPFIAIPFSYAAGSVSSSWQPAAFSETTAHPYSQTDRFIYRISVRNSTTNQVLYCYQQVWAIDRAQTATATPIPVEPTATPLPTEPTATPLPVAQVNITQMDIFPQSGVIRSGDSFGHNVSYTANVNTTLDVYGGWVYSGVSANTGTCLDQTIPPAPGTDFPFFAIPFSYAAGSVQSSWQPTAFSEMNDHPYSQTDRFVYRVSIRDTNTNQVLSCYQQVWTIER